MVDLLLALVVGSSVGAIASIFAYRRNETARFTDLLGPLRTDLADLHDRFDHWTKRERVRNSRQNREEQHSLPMNSALERAMMRQRHRGIHIGPIPKTEEGD